MALNLVHGASQRALEFAGQNPTIAGIVAVGAGAVAVVAAPAIVVSPVIGILHSVGFGAGGIVAGLSSRCSKKY